MTKNNFDKNYKATLEDTDLEDFRARLDAILAANDTLIGYGRAKDKKAGNGYFCQCTSKKTVESHGAFSYVYTDKELGDTVAIIGAERFQKARINIYAIWNSEAAEAYVFFTLWPFIHNHNLSWPDSMKIQDATETAAPAVEQQPIGAKQATTQQHRGTTGALEPMDEQPSNPQGNPIYESIELPQTNRLGGTLNAYELAVQGALRKHPNIQAREKQVDKITHEVFLSSNDASIGYLWVLDKQQAVLIRAQWEHSAIPFARDFHLLLSRATNRPLPEWLNAKERIAEQEQQPQDITVAAASEIKQQRVELKVELKQSQALPEKSPKQPTKKRPHEFILISGGLINWYAKVSNISLEDAAQKLEIPNSRYFRHSKDVYTDEDIAQLGTSWPELLEKVKASLAKFESFVQKKLLEKAVNRQ